MTIADVISRLTDVLGADRILLDEPRRRLYECDGLMQYRAIPAAVVFPLTTADVQAIVSICAETNTPYVARGSGTGLSGGALPIAEGVLIVLSKMRRILDIDVPNQRVTIEPGVVNSEISRAVAAHGLYYAPDPSSQTVCTIGGNVAENSGGAHCLKYGFTTNHVVAITVVTPDANVVHLGSTASVDAPGYDLLGAFVGSEGTLGIVTSVWLRFVPAPELALPVVAAFPDVGSGCRAAQACLACGIVPSALEYLEGSAVALVRDAFPGVFPDHAGFLLIAEADGDVDEARRGLEALCDVLADGAVAQWTPASRKEREALWRWRDGVGIAADGFLGGKVSEDIAVPIDRLAEAIEQTQAIAARHGLAGCSWGHAGDGNLHSTFMFRASDPAAARAAQSAADELFATAIALGGTISGEHGVGTVKAGQLQHQWPAAGVRLHGEIKRIFDPKRLLNPGKKVGA